MSAMDKYQEAKQKAEAARERMKETAKEAFREAASVLFSDHTDLVKFSWTQYTPYFNDGDACEFGTHTEYPYIYMAGDNADEDDDDEPEEFSTRLVEKKSPSERTPYENAGMAVVEFLKTFDEQTYLEMFGDHMKVVVTRDSVEVDEYDHD